MGAMQKRSKLLTNPAVRSNRKEDAGKVATGVDAVVVTGVQASFQRGFDENG
ncbi:hypothetical protein [Streptomyces sp. NPDC046197]|uniref:hypothetical protein n=1 Tax=Streptomyces sp. NPDC046197 TaxID=3154337 RepID=UPI0033D0D224